MSNILNGDFYSGAVFTALAELIIAQARNKEVYITPQNSRLLASFYKRGFLRSVQAETDTALFQTRTKLETGLDGRVYPVDYTVCIVNEPIRAKIELKELHDIEYMQALIEGVKVPQVDVKARARVLALAQEFDSGACAPSFFGYDAPKPIKSDLMSLL